MKDQSSVFDVHVQSGVSVRHASGGAERNLKARLEI